MNKILLFLLIPLLLLVFYATKIHSVTLDECEKESSVNVNDCIDLFSQKIGELSDQKKTLASQIAQYDTQIKVTQLKISEASNTIEQLEKEIGILGFRIGYVSESIGRLEQLVKKRIVATYQQSFTSNLELILASDDFADVMLRLQYLKQVQENDRRVLSSLQETRSNYANQKDEREVKQAAIEENKNKLEVLSASLDAQRKDKEAFLSVTKNDEARFQRLLTQAQAERAIVFGGGTETFIRGVSQGDSIGSIASHSVSPGCSTGAHLHFEVQKNGSLQNPNDFLQPTGFAYSYSSDQESYYGTINPHGSQPWPINQPIIIHQGYGSHPFAKAFYPNGIHTGIDMDSSSATVKAVKGGKLFGGSYSCSNGQLLYAKVEHDDGLVTWYLHMVPQ
ncbi:MAG: peptidase M23B [Parcubacteria group bacterium GW2011_GWA1_36_12]|nr:MAG: peptidase M23B [Parcubacteria group bacterium GW2011_GWA1_36_12]